jgi:hypothetical protein
MGYDSTLMVSATFASLFAGIRVVIYTLILHLSMWFLHL